MTTMYDTLTREELDREIRRLEAVLKSQNGRRDPNMPYVRDLERQLAQAYRRHEQDTANDFLNTKRKATIVAAIVAVVLGAIAALSMLPR